jgi:hypothetical protein
VNERGVIDGLTVLWVVTVLVVLLILLRVFHLI